MSDSFVTPWTIAFQAPLFMEISRQDYKSRLPFPSPRDLPDPGIKPGSPGLQADSLMSKPKSCQYSNSIKELYENSKKFNFFLLKISIKRILGYNHFQIHFQSPVCSPKLAHTFEGFPKEKCQKWNTATQRWISKPSTALNPLGSTVGMSIWK